MADQEEILKEEAEATAEEAAEVTEATEEEATKAEETKAEGADKAEKNQTKTGQKKMPTRLFRIMKNPKRRKN